MTSAPEVVRYNHAVDTFAECCCDMEPASNGGWVDVDDYDTLAARVRKLEEEVAALREDAERYPVLRDWFIRGGKRLEIDPAGHVRQTTPEVVDSWADAARATDTGDKK